ncbi:hypothetical protein HPB51_027347 [Rhipicephalus microplus]|uniref:Transposable element P transposase-like GTP-binding insertion domain-containing protein n=1 Tax=Rhipicephalus microplus TaxID=6941 RepID=A0A9J6D0B4_RHIMP|nr:hypothetical protein HPB51_027347 [Rhipicephalus microplus]
MKGMDASPGELENAAWTAAFRARKGDARHGSSSGGSYYGAAKAMESGVGRLWQGARCSATRLELFSHCTAVGIKLYKKAKVPGIENSEGTEIFTKMVNDLFDASNIKLPSRGGRRHTKETQDP